MHHVQSLLGARSRLRQPGPRLAVSCARQRFPAGNAGCREPVPVSSLVSRRLLFVQSRLRG
jgi:hypothetical protein